MKYFFVRFSIFVALSMGSGASFAMPLFGNFFNTTYQILKSNSYLQGSGLDAEHQELCGVKLDRKTETLRYYFRGFSTQKTVEWGEITLEKGRNSDYLISNEDDETVSIALKLKSYQIIGMSLFKDTRLLTDCRFVIFP